MIVFQVFSLASPAAEKGEEKEHLVHTVCNYTQGHVAELGVCTNMTINDSRE